MSTGLLKAKELDFIYYDINKTVDPEIKASILEDTGMTTVPIIFHLDDLIGGYEELVEYLS